MRYKYYIEDDGEEAKDAHEFESCFHEDEGAWIAEEAARHYHDDCDGWEASWPIAFTILDAAGKLIGRYEVEREHVPQFRAEEVTE